MMHLDERQLEPALSEKEIILRDNFVSQYLVDFDPVKACLRMGFQITYAIHWGPVLFNDGYVQRELAKFTTRTEDEASLKAKVKQRLLQIGLRGSDTASVSAIREYNAMHGWSKPDADDAAKDDLAALLRDFAQSAPA